MPKLTPVDHAKMREMRDEGISVYKLAEVFKVNRNTVRYHLDPEVKKKQLERSKRWHERSENKRRLQKYKRKRTMQKRELASKRTLGATGRVVSAHGRVRKRVLWDKARTQAGSARVRRGGDITTEWVYLRFLRKKCEATGLPFVFKKHHPPKPRDRPY